MIVCCGAAVALEDPEAGALDSCEACAFEDSETGGAASTLTFCWDVLFKLPASMARLRITWIALSTSVG
jgi:hypothetical protein